VTLTLTAPRPLISRDRLLGLCLLAAFAACYASVFASLVQQWMTNDVYAHGFLIPFISAYLLYERRARLSDTNVEPDVVGGSVLLGLGLGLLLLGHIGGLVSVAQASLLVSLTGTVLLVFGRKMLRQSWLALAYLIFMIPIWEFATGAFQGSFQLLSADIGTTLLRFVGIPVRHDGILLELPNVTLQVAEACSGVNFVVAILALSIPQAYLMLSGTAIRLAVMVFAVVVALLTNGLRVAVIGVVAYWGLSGADIHGPGHLLQGMSVAVIGFVTVFSTIYLLARWTRAGDPAYARDATDAAVPSIDDGRVSPKLALAVCAAFLSAAGLLVLSKPEPVELLAPVSTFSANLGAWQAGSTVAAPATFRNAGADTEISRMYAAPTGRLFHLYVAYFTYQVQGKELLTERVASLHSNAQPVTIRSADGSWTIEANGVVQPGEHRRYSLFWYDINGRTTPSRSAVKAWTIWDSIARRQSNGALVMVTADLPEDAAQAEVMAQTQELGALAAAALRSYLPR
jgi:EpsI family protein